MSNEELKNCPKCRGSHCVITLVGVYWAECLDCGCQTEGYGTSAEAIKAWNERTPDPRLREAVNQIVGIGMTLFVTEKSDFDKGKLRGIREALKTLCEYIPELTEW